MSEQDETAGWATISELARLRGVDKSAVSRRVARLTAQGLLTPRDGKGGTRLVNVAEFDRAAAVATDAVRQLNGRGADKAAPQSDLRADPILAREQARRVSYDADLKKLNLEERLGLLLPRDQAISSVVECSRRLRGVIEQMHTRAEEITSAVASGGVAGARA
jgi:DNA-binding MarR family transcriptional regulator